MSANLPSNYKRLYCLRDTKIGEFQAPCIFANDAAAMRSFGDMVTRDKNSLVALHPEDFTLEFLGLFNVENGILLQDVADIPESVHRTLATGSDFSVKE